MSAGTATSTTTTWGAVAALGLVTAVVLVGGAVSFDVAPPGAPDAANSADGGPATPFRGAGGACTLADPTGTGGCVTPAAAWMLQQVTAHFGPEPASCWDAHVWNPTSDHPKGRACDITIGTAGRFPNADDTAAGWVLANWLVVEASDLHVSYVIWQGRIWSAARSDEGWRQYTGGGVYDPTSPTGGHYDHVHVSVLP